jgi:hypothetical protein
MAKNNGFRLPQEFATFMGAIPNPIVKPGEGGPVGSSDITNNDVLLGRGAFFDKHPGNVQFRKIAAENQPENGYNSSKKIEKTFCGVKVVAIVRNLTPSGRFLLKNNKGYWEEIGDVKARKKAVQALRDGIRRKLTPSGSFLLKKNEVYWEENLASPLERQCHRGSNFLSGESMDSLKESSEPLDSSKICIHNPHQNAKPSKVSLNFNTNGEDHDLYGKSAFQKTMNSLY